ncbi:hypothetical protein [Brevibacterium album]|uniref:hypothetical protein n=1 Tax=Brevibacterium album TaxID=417948 RepID=UPI000411C19E|nr:hypothetical protein [Brevibacterium album]
MLALLLTAVSGCAGTGALGLGTWSGPTCDEEDLQRYTEEWAQGLSGYGYEYYGVDLLPDDFGTDTEIIDVDLENLEDAFGEGAGMVEGGAIVMTPDETSEDYAGGRNLTHTVTAAISPMTEIKEAQQGSYENYESTMRDRWGSELTSVEELDAQGWTWGAQASMAAEGVDNTELHLVAVGDGVLFMVQVMDVNIDFGWGDESEQEPADPIELAEVQPMADELLQAFCG